SVDLQHAAASDLAVLQLDLAQLVICHIGDSRHQHEGARHLLYSSVFLYHYRLASSLESLSSSVFMEAEMSANCFLYSLWGTSLPRPILCLDSMAKTLFMSAPAAMALPA